MIRPATKVDAKSLTALSFKSKGYWRYPKEYFLIWKDELTIQAEYIEKNAVYITEINGDIVGYYAIIEYRENVRLLKKTVSEGFWLEHMFIHPCYIQKGLGTAMFKHLQRYCKSIAVTQLNILADPNAKGFYEKMGCTYQKEYPSNIENRTTPYFTLYITPCLADNRM